MTNPVPFAPLPGLNSDDTTFKAEGRWADCDNVRFKLGAPQVIGAIEATGNTIASGTCRALLSWTVSAGTNFTAYGTTTKLYARSGGGAITDVSPSPAPTITAGIWTFQLWGDTLLANPYAGTIYQWSNNTGVIAAEITQAPNNITSILVTPERQVLALGCNEEVSGTFNGRCIRGCDLEDLTDWTTSASNNAFEHILEGGGQIVTGRMVGQYVAVWTTTDLWIGQFLGDPGQTYRFEKAGHGCGMGAGNVRAVAVLGSTAFWIGRDERFYVWTPGSAPVPIECPISKAFADDYASGSLGAPHVHTVTAENEVWFHYSTFAGSMAYVALNVRDGTWFKGSLIRSSMVDAGGSFPGPAGIDLVGVEYFHERVGGTAWPAWYITSSDVYADSARRRFMIRGIIPDFEDQAGDVSLTVNVRNRPKDSPTAKGPHTLTTATTKKDFRASGRLASFKFAGAAGNTYMRLGKPVFDVVPLGER